MVRHTRPMDAAGRRGAPVGQATRAVLAITGVSALIGLAACGSTTAGTGQAASAGAGHAKAPAGVALCAGAQKVDQVMMRLTASTGHEILPRAITITDASRARALATAVCALPPLPRGLRCPAPLHGALMLEFAAGGRVYHTLRIQDSGCASITGAGPARQWSWSSRPGQLLSSAVGGRGRLVPGTHPSSVPTP